MAEAEGKPEDIGLGLTMDPGIYDRRFDGYIPNRSRSVHKVHKAILPLKLFCTTESCQENKNQVGGFLGTCFVVKELNRSAKNEGVLCCATAAHNLVCRECKEYRWIKVILDWDSGENRSKEWLLGADSGVKGPSNENGWMKVSDKYLELLKSGKSKVKDQFPFDFGLLAVKYDVKHVDWAKDVVENSFSAAQLLPGSNEFHAKAFLCGYPARVCNSSESVPPQFSGPPPKGCDYYKPPIGTEEHKVMWKGQAFFWWQVQGGMFWVKPSRCRSGKQPKAGDEPVDLYKNERLTAALFSVEQFHNIGEVYDDYEQAARKQLFRHYLDSYGGQSGSPMYTENGGEYQAVGIHVGAWNKGSTVKGAHDPKYDFNVAVRLSQVISTLIKWTEEEQRLAAPAGNELQDGTEGMIVHCCVYG